MTRTQLADEFTRRYKKQPGQRQPLTRNESGYKYRLYLIQEDLKNGINPYHNNFFPSDGGSLSPQQYPSVRQPSSPSQTSDD